MKMCEACGRLVITSRTRGIDRILNADDRQPHSRTCPAIPQRQGVAIPAQLLMECDIKPTPRRIVCLKTLIAYEGEVGITYERWGEVSGTTDDVLRQIGAQFAKAGLISSETKDRIAHWRLSKSSFARLGELAEKDAATGS